MEKYLHITMAMLAVINPAVCASMLITILKSGTPRNKILNATKAMLTVFVILVIAAIAGQYILNMFGISMDAFKAVGGIILAVIGFKMLLDVNSDAGGNSTTTDEDLTPVILFAASPGTMVMVVTLAAVHHEGVVPISTIIGIAAAIIVSIVVISAALLAAKNKKQGKPGIMSKFMGLLVAAMGLQFLLDGLKDFF